MYSCQPLTETLQLLEPIVSWGSQDTWLAYDRDKQRHLAVQLEASKPGEDPSEAWRRFREYVRGPARVASSRMAALIDAGIAHDGRLFAAFELLQGESLALRSSRQGPLDLQSVGALISQVGQALALLHGRGFVHGGLSSDNVVLLDADLLLVKLVEMGHVGRAPLVLGDVDEMPTLGLAFASPEQIAGGEVDERTDVWALGVLAYHALTGWLPFAGNRVADLMVAISEAPCPELPRFMCRGKLRVVARRLERWFTRALAKRADERFASVEQAVAAWRAASGASFDDDSFAVDRVSFCDHPGTDTVTAIAPWLLNAAAEAPPIPNQDEEETFIFVPVEFAPVESELRAIDDDAVDRRFIA